MSTGSRQALTVAIGEAFAPIAEHMHPARLHLLLAELGVAAPDDPDSDAGLKQTIEDTAAAIDGLADAAHALSHQEEASTADVATVLGFLTACVAMFHELAGALSDVTPEELAQRLGDYALVSHLELHHPLVAALAALFGVVERQEPDDGTPRYTVHGDRLAELVTGPSDLLADLWDWGGADTFDADAFLDVVVRLLAALRLPVVKEDDDGTPQLRTPLFELAAPEDAPSGADDEPGLELSMVGELAADLDVAEPLNDDWTLAISITTGASLGTGFWITPPARVQPLAPEAGVDGQVTITVTRSSDEPVLVLGEPDATRLTAGEISLGFALSFAADTDDVETGLGFEFALDDGAAVLDLGGGDGFLSSFLPSEATLAFDAGLTWDDEHGLAVRGSAGTELVIPLGRTIGPVHLDTLTVALAAEGDGMALSALLAVGFDLGPLEVAVGGIGARLLARYDDEQGDIGPVALDLAFQPPTGLGLRVDAGPVTGAGFVDFEPDIGRYSGILQLSLGDEVGLTAIGLLDTQLPDGQDGFAFLLLISATFPPVTLPFGFLLTGAGGLVGINRQIDTDELQQRFETGAAGRILNPEDPLDDAPALFDDLAAVFPPTSGTFVVGPTLQLGWTAIVRFDLGVFIQLPGPEKIVLLGSARAVVESPAGDPYVQIRLDIVGVIDLAKRDIAFDAVLIDSHLLEVFELTGGAAFRLNWGAQPHVVLSLGGFHPRYDPAPLEFPSTLTRIAMTRGSPSDSFYLRFEGYFALTSNTLQLGAAVEILLRAGRFEAHGGFSFDALVTFQPFGFEFDLRAHLEIAFRGRTLAGVKVTGSLSGPGPVEFVGELEFRILFVSVSWSGSRQLGSSSPPAVTPIDSAVDELVAALEDPRNLATDGASGTVLLSVDGDGDGDDTPVLAPASRLVWQQGTAPLGLLLERFQGAPLTTPERVDVAADGYDLAPVDDAFAPGQFIEYDDAEKLDAPAFEDLAAGVAVDVDDHAQAEPVELDIEFDEYRLPEMTHLIGLARALPAWLLAAADGHTGTAPSEPRIAIDKTRFDVRGQDAELVAGGLSASQARQVSRHRSPGSVTTVAGDLVDVGALEL